MPAKRKIGGYDEDYLVKRASELVAKKCANSTIFCEDAETKVPRFAMSELEVGRVLGRGGFCVVNEIRKVTLSAAVVESVVENGAGKNGDVNGEKSGKMSRRDSASWGNLVQDREFIAERCIRKGKDARYAIKQLSDDILKEPERFVAGIIDFSIESRFLSVIKHPNIIKMRAMAIGDSHQPGFFVVLDRLYDTLTTKIEKWKKEKGKVSGVAKIRDLKGNKKKELWLERILVAYDLSSALKYLHSLNILYRDLKPDNIGFDVRGDVKLFDFGLSRESRAEDKMADDLYKYSGNTGSLRYMAPEVAKEKPYNSTVDVYSFGILMWQIFSLSVPFSGYNLRTHQDLVINKGYRPKVPNSWSSILSTMLPRCWSENIKDRPSMEEVSELLRNEASMLSGEDGIGDDLDVSCRTEKSEANKSQKN